MFTKTVAIKNLEIPVRLNDIYALHTDKIFENMIKAMDEVKWKNDATSDDIKKYITQAFLQTIDKNKENRDIYEMQLMKEIIIMTADIITSKIRNVFIYKEKLKKKLKDDILNLLNQENPNLVDPVVRSKVKMLGLTLDDINYITVLHPKPKKIPNEYFAKLLYDTTTMRLLKRAIAMMQGYYEDSPHGFGLKKESKNEKILELNRLAGSAMQLKGLHKEAINDMIMSVINTYNAWCDGKKLKREEIIKKLVEGNQEHHLGRMCAIILFYLNEANLINENLESKIKIKIDFFKKPLKFYPDLIELLDEITQFEIDKKKIEEDMKKKPAPKIIDSKNVNQEIKKPHVIIENTNHARIASTSPVPTPLPISAKDHKAIKASPSSIFADNSEPLVECKKLINAVQNIELNSDETDDESISTILFTLQKDLMSENLKRKNPNNSAVVELNNIKKLIDAAITSLPDNSELQTILKNLTDAKENVITRKKTK